MNLEELITNYKSPEAANLLIRNTKIVLLAGITGAGKDTVKRELLKNTQFRDIVSHTTRQPRANNGIMEVSGVDYNFINQAEAEQMIARGQFIEAKFVHGTVYGTSVAALEEISQEGKVAITDVDVQGVAEYKSASQKVIAIFIVPPDFETWRERLKIRYGLTEVSHEDWAKRRESAIRELKHALLVPYYHFVINDNLDQAVLAVMKIASHESDEFHSKDDEARLMARTFLEKIIDFND